MKVESSDIPLLASPQGGVAEPVRRFREASADREAGVVFRLRTKGKPPRLQLLFLWRFRPRVADGAADTVKRDLVVRREQRQSMGDSGTRNNAVGGVSMKSSR